MQPGGTGSAIGNQILISLDPSPSPIPIPNPSSFSLTENVPSFRW
jgi:hypothetical protein